VWLIIQCSSLQTQEHHQSFPDACQQSHETVTNLTNILKRKLAVTAKQEQEICDLEQLMEATNAKLAHPNDMQLTMPSTLMMPFRMVPVQHDTPALPRMQPPATPPRVPEGAKDNCTHITRLMMAAPTMSPLPIATSQLAQQCKQQLASQHAREESPAARPRTRAVTAQEAAQNTTPAMCTRSKNTGTASVAWEQFTCMDMENEVHQALAVMDKQTGKLLNYRQLIRSPTYKAAWSISAANKYGRLAQDVGSRIKGTNTICFIHQHKVPKDWMKDVTYGQFVSTKWPEKSKTNWTWFTVGGNRINYPGEVATPTTEMLMAKLLFNSTISTKGTRLMTINISNFYLNSPLPHPEFIKIKHSNIPDKIINKYNLRDKATPTNSVYIITTKRMYGLLQAGLIANELLKKHLNKHGYHQSKLVPGLREHETWPIQFTLVADDFRVKYVGKEHALHLKKVLEKRYQIKCDWSGQQYIGIMLDWDY
jgi:hypothetical protein